MTPIKLKDVKKGDFFTLKPIEEPSNNQVYIKGEYDRSEKKYLCNKWSDYLGSGRYFKGNKIVYVDFTF